ncbi:sulfatase-like hydrolase/transferase [Rubritalea marina]|uniref:sulfatase-like hydrolase/transferase n=1 Tax=Rubritalea marina TaxID=361055 RepID=UPI00037D896B|nr:sulfatase-like hydrolase/transferase [Rubritalea marina]
MYSRKILWFTGLIALALSFMARADERPNILILFADDHAYDALHAHGNSVVKTPHLDKLVERGVSFSHAYNSGAWNGAVCMASRRMLMTGKQVWGASKFNVATAVNNREMLPQRIADAGYDTYYAGKWHVGPQVFCEKTWGNTRNIRPGMPNQTKARYERDFTPGRDTWDPADPDFQGFWKGGKHWSEVLADDAELFFEQVKKSEKPFCMMLAFNAPHDPRQAPQAFQDLYPYDTIPVPDNFLSEYPYDLKEKKIRDEMLAPFPRTKHSVQVNQSEYYALVSHMDAQIGKILAHLEASGKAENTYIIFTADHGLGCGQHGLLGKQNMYDHSVRVPFIVVGPKLPAGKTVRSPIYLQSAMATALELSGAKKPEGLEFESFLPLIHADTRMRDIYSSYCDSQRMVTDGRWKYISYPLLSQDLLIDLRADPSEKKNLSKNPEYQSVLETMQAKLKQQMLAMQDPMDLDNPAESYAKFGPQRAKKKKKSSGH